MSRERLEGEETVDHPIFLSLLWPHLQPVLSVNIGKEHTVGEAVPLLLVFCVSLNNIALFPFEAISGSSTKHNSELSAPYSIKDTAHLPYIGFESY